jgi:hypothetical protein
MLPLRTKVLLAIGSLWCVLITSVPVLAHHSTAMYNMATPVTVTGVVKRFEWTNPHAFVFLDVKDDKGQTVVWEVEMMSLTSSRVWVGAGHGQARGRDFLPGGAAKSRAVDDQLVHEIGGWRMIKS